MGFFALDSKIYHKDLKLGKNVCVNDGAVNYQGKEGGSGDVDDRVFIHKVQFCASVIVFSPSSNLFRIKEQGSVFQSFPYLLQTEPD